MVMALALGKVESMLILRRRLARDWLRAVMDT